MEDPEGNNLYQYKETAPQKRRNRRHETRPSTSVLFEQMITDLRKTDWLLYCQRLFRIYHDALTSILIPFLFL